MNISVCTYAYGCCGPVENSAIIFSWEVAIHEPNGLAEVVSLSHL